MEKNVNLNIISLILVKDLVLLGSLGSKYIRNMDFLLPLVPPLANP